MLPKDEIQSGRTLGKRLAFWVMLVSLVLSAAVLLVLFPLERRTIRKAQEERLGLLAETVATGYDVVDETRRSHPARELLEDFARVDEITRIEVTDDKGVVIESTEARTQGAQRRLDAKRILWAETTRTETAIVYNIPWTQNCVGCHKRGGDPVGSVRVVVMESGQLTMLERFHIYFALAFLTILLVFAGLILWLTQRFVTKPVAALEKVMESAARGDVLVRAKVTSDDEVGRLAGRFNGMLKSMTDMKASEIEREADLQSARRALKHKEEIEDINARLKSSHEELERRVRAQALLVEAAHRFGGTLKREALLERLAALLDGTFQWPDFAIFLVAQDQKGEPFLKCEFTSGRADIQTLKDLTFLVGESVTGYVAETGAVQRVRDLRHEQELPGRPTSMLAEGAVGEGAMMAVPMLYKGEVMGVIDFFAPEGEGLEVFDDSFEEVMQALAVQASMALVNVHLYERTHELSVTDPLTGLMNRRALERQMEVEITRAQRFNQPLTMLMIDVDHFKNYNDRMGHLLGDRALRAVSKALSGSVRAVDAVARFGGEEFSVILPRTGLADAREVAEKLRQSISELDLPGGAEQPLGKMSISVGMAVFPEHMPPAIDRPAGEVLLERADLAVYRAKDSGRDQVCEPPPVDE